MDVSLLSMLSLDLSVFLSLTLKKIVLEKKFLNKFIKNVEH